MVSGSRPQLDCPILTHWLGSVKNVISWGQKEEGLLVDIASADPARVAFHWEGPDGCYEEGVAHRDAVLDRVLTFCRDWRG